MAAQRIAFKVHGTVQGVGFRDFTQKRAAEYGLAGWVGNTNCGRVEGEAQGPEDAIQKLLKDLDKGPRLAHVVKLEKKTLSTTDSGDGHFGVRRTSESVFDSL
ncbi:Acylphosphatase-like domain-containing protein [Aspergillus egyptiacus]|nr:Acylphosphatase-like domain-containing protein [Aspergillus egyptiacus]